MEDVNLYNEGCINNFFWYILVSMSNETSINNSAEKSEKLNGSSLDNNHSEKNKKGLLKNLFTYFKKWLFIE